MEYLILLKYFQRSLFISILILVFSCSKFSRGTELSYGAFVEKDGVRFKLYAPRSYSVDLILFDNFDDINGKPISMYRVSNGDWELFVSGIGLGTIYGYKLKGPNNKIVL